MTKTIVSLMCLLCIGAQLAWAEPINIESRRELFVDHYLIEKMDGVELRLHHPVKAPRAKSPLPVRHMKTIIKDGDLYRAWYRDSDRSYKGKVHTGHPGETVEYAESRDGREWTFPTLGLFEVEGTKENNVVLAKQPPFATNFSPFLDTKPGVDQAERFKALAGYPGPGDKRGTNEPGRGLYAFVSPDGIHWTRKEEVIPYQSHWRHAFDSLNVAFWSEAEQLYVCYFRTWTPGERLRSVARTTSPDFENWSTPVEMNPNLPGEHLYTNMTQPYFRAPHIYVAFPTRFVPDRGDAPGYDKKDVNATDILFMTTRAGSEHYDRTFTEAFIRPGLSPKQWGNRANYVAQNIHQTSPTELSIYHRNGDRYTLRLDGFISVHAGSKMGELLTKPLTFSGDELVVNYSTSVVGGVQVELQEADGTPIPGFTLKDCPPIYGDAIEEQIRWTGNGDLASLAGKVVRMRFVLKEADLYSFRFH